MNWDLTGKSIIGDHTRHGIVYGAVEDSRVKFGGHVQHTVAVTSPADLRGQVVLLKHDQILQIIDSYQ